MKIKYNHNGYFHLTPYAMIIASAAYVLMSGRDISFGMHDILSSQGGRTSIDMWVQRFSTLLILTVSFERIIHSLKNNRIVDKRTTILISSIIIYWITAVILPSFFSNNPEFSHEYIYCIPILIAAGLLVETEKALLINSTKNCLSFIIAISWLFVFIKPAMVLELNYTQGIISGIPRFAGITPHAITMGFFSLLLIILNKSFPYSSNNINRTINTIALLSLFLSQSKTAIAILAIIFMYYFINNDSRTLTKKTKYVIVFLSLTLLTLFLTGFELFNISGEHKESLTSLTGRDVIWEKILIDSNFHSIFGYGRSYFSDLNVAHITHGHNQLLDIYAKSGEIGLTGLCLLLLVCTYLALHKRKGYNHLTFTAYLLVATKCMTEIPLNIHGYSYETITIIILVATISSTRKNLNRS